MQINEDFEQYYGAVYGERWPALRESLLCPAAPFLFADELVKPYSMDYASVLAALALRLPEDGIVLDACAAPGGKTLVLASGLAAGTGLVANELSAERRRRLLRVLADHLDGEKRQRVKVTGIDAAKLGGTKAELGKYNAILLDAPCSSERHVLQNEKELSKWTSARIRFLSQRQWGLLSAAFLILKNGGSLVYSTCAINPDENEGVVKRLLKKYGDAVVLDEPEFSEGEKTLYGKIILPDSSGGIGPMYVARFTKKSVPVIADIPEKKAGSRSGWSGKAPVSAGNYFS